MKKTLSISVAAILAIALAISSFAATEKNDIAAQLNAMVAYITDGITSYNVDTATDYYYFAKSAEKATEYYGGFLENVKENIDANGGKIVSLYGENMTTYAAVIGIIDAMGGDPRNVNSVDLTKLLAGADIASISNPYHYNIVIPVMAKYCDESVVKAVCDDFITNYYTMGSGMDYWGFASDNTAMFISAVAQSGLECYNDVLDDAMAVLDTYKTEGGYCYNPEYGTEANADSTGLALMAKCRYFDYKGSVSENIEELNSIYAELLTFKGETEGSFVSYGAESVYAAADALRGIAAFYEVLPEKTADTPTEEKPDDNGNANTNANNNSNGGTKPGATQKPNEIKNPEIPNTGNEMAIISSGALALSLIGITVSLKKEKH